MPTPAHPPKTSARNVLGVSVLAIILVFVGIFGLFLAQQQIQLPQETRTEATNPSGQAFLSMSPQSGSGFNINQQATVDLNLNTAGIQSSNVDLVFSILTETTDSVIVQSYADTNLDIEEQEIEQITGGLLVRYRATPINGTFASNDNKRILSIVFTPTRTGEFKVSFDNEESQVIRNDTSFDILRPISTATYNIINPTAGVVRNCNDTCDSNAQCAVNHRCYEGRCRLVTNPTSTSCVNPPDQGLNRQCNQYCADTNECASGLSCFFNRCRRPDNPDNVSCAIPSATLQQQIAASCNATCTTNAECAVNLRCYQGNCRLATNVSSLSCSPVTKPTVSPLYGDETKGGVTITPTPAPGSTATPSASVTPSTGSATATGSGIVSPQPSPMPSPSPTVTPVPIVEPESDSFVSRLGVMLPMLALAGGGLLLIAVIISLLLGLAKRRRGNGSTTVTKAASNYESELQSKINALQAQTPPSSSMPPVAPIQPSPAPTLTPVPPPPEPPAAKLPSATAPTSTLKLQAAPVVTRPQAGPTVSPAAAMPTNRPTPVHPVMPTRPNPWSEPATSMPPAQPVTPPPSPAGAPLAATAQTETPAKPLVTPTVSAPQPARPSSASSMLDRMKQKGIVTPGQSSADSKQP